MVRSAVGKMVCWAMFAALTLSFAAVTPTLAAPAAGPVKKVLKKRGRLPANYDKVVTDAQREQIYTIQEEYKAKIDAAEAQLKALRQERDKKVAAVLTAEQTKQLQDEAASKKAAKSAAKTDKPAAKPAAKSAEKPATPAAK